MTLQLQEWTVNYTPMVIDDDLSTADHLETNEEEDNAEDNMPIIVDTSHQGTHHKAHNLDSSCNDEDKCDNICDKHANTPQLNDNDEQ